MRFHTSKQCNNMVCLLYMVSVPCDIIAFRPSDNLTYNPTCGWAWKRTSLVTHVQKTQQKRHVQVLLQWKKHDIVPSWVHFQWRKWDIVPSRAPFSWENLMQCDIWCLSSGENVIESRFDFVFRPCPSDRQSLLLVAISFYGWLVRTAWLFQRKWNIEYITSRRDEFSYCGFIVLRTEDIQDQVMNLV